MTCRSAQYVISHEPIKALLLFMLVFISVNIKAQVKSYKRGVGYGFHSAKDMEQFSKNMSWWYNWAPEPDAAIKTTYQNYGVDFTPMAWNSVGIPAVNAWVTNDPNVNYILGFNEPNFKDQANMTPTQAAAAWPSFETIANTNNLKTVGPAVNYCGDCVSEGGVTYNDPFKYLDDFFTACVGCKVDYIALHWYGSGNSIVGYIENARKYNKPIWVTEFASWDNSNPVKSVEEQMKYLAGTVNFLERDPDVYRYAWFIGRRNSGQTTYPFIDLYGADGTLTPLGQLYMDIPVYDPDYKFQIPGRIEVEEYYLMKGLFAEMTEDTDGFLNIGWVDNNDWAEYKINVSETATYKIGARVAGINTGVIAILIDGASKATINTPSTGGWQNWQTITTKIELEAGEHLLRMEVKDAGFNINYLEIFDENYVRPDNFKIEGIGETCLDKNNGQIKISAVESNNYIAIVNGVEYNFSTSKNIDNLLPGAYDICITDTNASFKQCFNVDIPKATKIVGKSAINSNKAEIEISNGTAPFNVFLNNVKVLQTKTPFFNINVDHGDLIEVKTAVSCEGIFSQEVDLFNEIIVYPNPTNWLVEIVLPINEKEVQVELYNLQSQLISSKIYSVLYGKIQISLDEKPSGIYVAKLNLKTPVLLKIIKL